METVPGVAGAGGPGRAMAGPGSAECGSGLAGAEPDSGAQTSG